MPPPQMAPKKKSHKKLWIGLILAVIVLVIIISATNHGGSTTPATTTQTTQASQPTAQPTPAPTPKPTAKPAPTFAQFGDGTYQIGKDIQSGTYRTRVGSPGCYYARLSGFGGTVGEIIANNAADALAIVTIAATDKGFTSQNCGTWTKQ